jgi:uncharacterized protein (TIGR02001 family)
MKIKSTSTFALLSLLAGAAMAQTAAPAPAPAPESTLSFNVGVVTDYRFRGISQTSFGPALQGGVDYSHKSGVYVGAWASNIKWIEEFGGAKDGSLEIDLYGGYKGSIADDLSFDVGLITYQYPNNKLADVAGFTNANTSEFYGALTYKVVTLKYSRSMGDFLGNINSNGSDYWDLSATLDLGNGFSLVPHVGKQVVTNGSVYNYSDYSITLGKDFGNGLTASFALVGTDANQMAYSNTNPADGKFLGKSGAFAGVKYSF